MKSIMVDLETLGTKADAVIMSIGAVKFDLATGVIDDAGFYASISIDSNLELKRRISEDTLIWWIGQTAAAQKVFKESKQTLSDALEDFSDWAGDGDALVWSNGASFDIPMVEHAYNQLQLETPWKSHNSRCVRTYKNLPGADRVQVPFAGVQHNALNDAVHQAKLVCAIHQALFARSIVAA